MHNCNKKEVASVMRFWSHIYPLFEHTCLYYLPVFLLWIFFSVERRNIRYLGSSFQIVMFKPLSYWAFFYVLSVTIAIPSYNSHHKNVRWTLVR